MAHPGKGGRGRATIGDLLAGFAREDAEFRKAVNKPATGTRNDLVVVPHNNPALYTARVPESTLHYEYVVPLLPAFTGGSPK
jgi:hypothetical protein